MASQRDDTLASSLSDTDQRLFGFQDDESWLDRLRESESPAALGSIGPFELIKEVSRGGQGIVYRARQPGTKREIAIKRLVAGSLATESMRRRFEREIEIAATLNHPNVVTIYGLDQVDEQPLLAMEWIDGRPLNVWAAGEDGRPRSAKEVAAMIGRVCDAVLHAHQRGVIHRDLKPSNILVDAAGEPHVLDFGLAKLLEPDSAPAHHITRTEHFVGTAAYASPEHVAGSGPLDVRSDVYSLGVILYELWTGRLPYELSGTAAEQHRAIQDKDPARPSTIAAHLDTELDAIVMKAMAKDPAHRYQSVDALADDLRRYAAGEAVLAHPPGTVYQLRKLMRKHRVPVALAALAFVLAAALAVTATVQAVRIAGERDRARTETAKAEAISGFLRGMFAAANPERGGENVRVVDILRDAAERVDREFTGQPEVGVALNTTLGETYFGLGLYEAADERYTAALHTARSKLGDRDKVTLETMSSLGVVRSVRNRLDEASALLEPAYAGFVETFGDQDAQTLIAANNLAGLYRRMGRTGDAERLYRRTYEIRMGTLGPDHMDTLASQNNLSMMLLALGKAAEAAPLVRDTLSGCEKLLGKTHPKTLLVANNYARLLHQLDRYDESSSTYRRLIAARKELLPEDHPDILLSMYNLAQVRRSAGDEDQALDLLQRIHAAYQAMPPPAAPSHWHGRGKGLFQHQVIHEMVEIHVGRGEADRAVDLFVDSLAHPERLSAEDRWHLGELQHAYGRLLMDLERFAEAHRALTAAVETLVAARGEDSPEASAAKQSLRALSETR